MVLVFVFFLIILTLSIVIFSIHTGISPMPTSMKTKKRLLDLLPKEIQGTIYELGAGWGSILIPLALKFKNNPVIGFELSIVPWFITWLRLNCLGKKKVVCKDFFSMSLKDAALIYCYLYPGAMEKLKIKFEKELLPGTIIISNCFRIPGWEPKEIVEIKDLWRSRLYYYIIK